MDYFPKGTKVKVFMRYKDIPECSGVVVCTFTGEHQHVKVMIDNNSNITEFVKRYWKDEGYFSEGNFFAFFPQEYLEKM